jgi:cobalt-precorrin 5A hydrolase
MELGEAVIVAGIGSRKGVAVGEVVAAIEAALAEYCIEHAELAMIATARMKQDEAGILAAGGALGLPLILVDDEALAEMADGVLTHSSLSLSVAGTPSVAEAAALAAAGEGARLAGPRMVVGNVTCAIALGEDQ